MVHASRGFVKPPSDDVRSEPWIVAQIASATLRGKAGIDWNWLVADYDRIREKIEAVFPEFHDFNQRVRKPGGFPLPNSASDRVWKTDSGKANFMVSRGLHEDEKSDDEMVLRLTTLRSHDQFNTTVYALNDRYRGVFGRRDIVFLNENEMIRRGLAEGDLVELVTALSFAREDRIVRGLTLVKFDLPDGCCASYYPETQPLIALENHDPHSGTPSYKSVPVHIRRSDGGSDVDRVVVREGVAGSPFPADPSARRRPELVA